MLHNFSNDDGANPFGNLVEAANGKFYFNLKSTNGQVVGSSQMYASLSSSDDGIASVKSNAPDATVEDKSV